MHDSIPQPALKEFARRFTQATRQPWYYLAPWTVLMDIKVAYCKQTDFPLEENPEQLAQLAAAYQQYERKTYALGFIEYVQGIHALIGANPDDPISRCMLDFAVAENFRWLNQQRSVPLHPRLAEIIVGLLKHYVHQQIDLSIFQPELVVNWVGNATIAPGGWLKRPDPTKQNPWGFQKHEDGKTYPIQIARTGLLITPLKQLIPTAQRSWYTKPYETHPFLEDAVRNLDRSILLERFCKSLGA